MSATANGECKITGTVSPLTLKSRDELMAENEKLRAAAEDALAGWRYIREMHGNLYGVGWDRVENKLTEALKEGRQP